MTCTGNTTKLKRIGHCFKPRKGGRKRERNGLQKSPGRRLALE